MSELENELLNNTDDSGSDVQQETPETENKTDLQGELNKINPPSSTPETPQELWKQTKQFEQGLWKTPDDVYNSVKYYEQKFQPLEQSLKRMGFKEPSELEQAYKEYQEKLPVYQENENTINLLNALLQNDVYGSKLRGVFDEIRKAQEMERFGMAFDDLPPIIKEKVTKGEQALQMVEELKQEKAYNEALGTIQEQMAQIEQIVNDNGLEFDAQAFLEYCRDNNIPPNAMQGEFLKSNYSQMLEKAKQNASLATTVQNKQNKANAVNSSTKGQAAPPPKEIKDEYDLKQALLAID
jgi:hypothetical protein